jgi:uncharacterized protein (TIGR03118 family)
MNRFWTLVTVGIAASMPILAQTYATPGFTYLRHNLVSNVPGLADVTDPNLVDPWGMSFTANSPFWVSNHLTGTSTLYNGAGTITPLVVTVPPGKATAGNGRPTGQARFGTSFIFCTDDGTISAWTSGAAAVLKVDNSAAGAVYKGMAVAGGLIYAANFKTGNIDVFNALYAPTTVPGGFKDANLAAGYAPFNVVNLNGKLYVTYAKQDAAKAADVPGPGNGAVNIFDYNGNLLQRFLTPSVTTHNTAVNSPWGVAQAPPAWGVFGGTTLIGSFGNGRISAFSADTGYFLGELADETETVITIPGLWTLAFGGDGSRSDPNTLYFTAGVPDGGTDRTSFLGTINPPADISHIYNSAGWQVSAVSPGELVTIVGHTVGPEPAISATIPKTGAVGTTLGKVTVQFNGISAPILYVSGSSVNTIVPYGVAGSATANVMAFYDGRFTQSFPIAIAPTAPALFTANSSGTGQVLAFNSDGTINSDSNPAAAGSLVTLYATGEGVTNPAGKDGVVAAADGAGVPVAPVSVLVATQPAAVKSAGSASGMVSGIMKVQATIPPTVPAGPAPIFLIVGTSQSPRDVFISVK